MLDTRISSYVNFTKWFKLLIKSHFEYENYKDLVRSLLENMPRRGYGQLRKIAEHLNISAVIVSQVFAGDRHLSEEHALDLCGYFGFSPLETKYFLLLVQMERAGNHRLKKFYANQLKEIREKSKELKSRVPQDMQLDESAKALFYSNWYYSGIRMTSSIEGLNTVDAIAEHLHLPRATVKQVTEFLVSKGLCVEEDGKIRMGPSLTHLEAASPLLPRSLSNWRLRGLQNLETTAEDELFYSAPMSLSVADTAWVREKLVLVIQEILSRVKVSESQKLACLNIDWFDFRPRR